jgi:uncharacterized protein (DUF58 family)
MFGKTRFGEIRAGCDFRATWGGIAFLTAWMLIGLAAVNTQRAMLFVVFGLMTGAFLLSLAISRRMLQAVDCRRDLPERTFAGRVVYLGYLLRHRRGRTPVLGLEVQEIRPPAELDSVGAFCLHLSRAGAFKSGSRFTVRRRGRFRLPGMRLSTRFPFSLVRARRDLPQEATLVVWPALGQLRADVLARGAAEISDAPPGRVQSGSDEFFGLREYRPGDSPRWIHWKRTAASGNLVVREMSRPRPDVLFLLLDTQLPDRSPESLKRRERLIGFAATLIEYSFRREYRVGLALAYRDRLRVLAAAAGRGQRMALLDALADIDENLQYSFQRALGGVPPRLLHQAHVVVVGPGPVLPANLAAIRAACRRLTAVSLENLPEFYRDDADDRPAGVSSGKGS